MTKVKTKQMTILFVADNIGIGGKERRMSELIKSLSGLVSYNIILISLTQTEFVYEYLYTFPITIIESKRRFRFSLSPFFMIRNAIKKYKPDVVHSWSSMGSIFMLPMLFSRKFKFVNGIISDAPMNVHWYQKSYLRGMLTYPFSDVIISNSMAGIKSYRAPVRKTICIYNGIDPNRFKNLPEIKKVKQDNGIAHFGYIVGMVGAFHRRKDFDTFVKAAKIIININKDICFLLIGEGKTRPRIKKKLSEMDKQNIFFLGRRSDVESLMQVFNIGVLCTNLKFHGEGISNSIIEYMSLKKPVIATEGGGTGEVIVNGENGYLIADKDVQSLVKKILYLFHNPAIEKRMGEMAAATIQKKFLLDRMTKEYISVYNQK